MSLVALRKAGERISELEEVIENAIDRLKKSQQLANSQESAENCRRVLSELELAMAKG